MKGIIIFIIGFCSVNLIGQRPIEVITQLSQPIPTEVGDLYEQYQNYTVTVINHTDKEQTIYFLADLIGDNGVSITMDRFYRPEEGFTIDPNGVELLTAEDIEELNTSLTEDQLFFEGISRDQLIFGSIPEGNYQLCINAFDFETETIMSIGCTMSFYVGNANIPTIITPFEEEVIPASDLPVFNISWEFPSNDPMRALDLSYEVKIVDITENYDWDIEELFADNGIPVHLEEVVEGQTFYLYNQFGDDPPLESGHEYGLRVRAFDPMDETFIHNAGYTEIRRFWYGNSGEILIDTTATNDVVQTDSIPADCEGRCNPLLPGNNTPVTDLSQISTLKIGHFYLENYDLTASGNRFSGEAEITLDFINGIKVKVDVNGVKINSSGEIYEGNVKSQLAQEESIQGIAEYLRIPDSAQPALEYIPEQHQNSIINILEFTRTVDALLGNDAVGLPLGFPMALKGNEMYLGITDLLLTPQGAKAKVMVSAKLALFEGENSLLLTGDSICIHPEGFGGEYEFGLYNDLNIVSNDVNNFELFLTGNSSSDNYCHIEMGCEGVESLHLYGHLLFPRSLLTPVVEEGTTLDPNQKVRADFGFSLDQNESQDTSTQSSHVNWISAVSMDRFEITGLKGWEFEIQNAYLDMSDLSNPSDIQFPEDYHTSTPDFRGFYLKDAYLKPPEHLLLDSTAVYVRDLLIDPAIYGKIEVEHVLPIEKGNLAGYGFGIDSLKLHFYDNALVSGMMKGPLQIPITDITDSLQYYALIEDTSLPEDDASFAYIFDVSFQDTVSFPFLIAEAEIYDDSYLDIGFIPSADEDVFVQTYLHGMLDINTEKFYPSSLPSLPAQAKLIGLEFALDYTSGVGFNGDNTYVSFASPQKALGGFPINMDNFDVGLNANYETVALQFGVDISFAKGEMDLGAGVTFSIVSNLETTDAFGNILSGGVQGATKTLKSLRLEKIQFDSIRISVDKGSFGFEGYIAFYNNELPDGRRDKGVKGGVTVQLPVGGITGRLEAIFGTVGEMPDVPFGVSFDYSEDYFTYWYVNGLIAMGTGIPLCQGVGLYGLGGGVGYNMIQTASSQVIDGQVVGDPVFSPVFGSFRLQFTVILGTHPKPDAFNADNTIIAQFVNGGLDMLGLEGDGYVMTPMNERLDPQVYVGVGIYFYTQNEERDWYIDGNMKVAVNVAEGKFRGNIQNSSIPNQMVDAHFFVNADTWHFYAGEPDMNPYDNIDPRGSAEFFVNENVKADFKAYMMVGHGVPLSLPPLPADIQRILDNPSGDMEDTESVENVSSSVSESDAETGSGFAHGSTGRLSASIDAKIIYADFNVCVGYDMNLTQRPYNCANTGGRIGINGWYAEGQAYAGIEGNLGVQIKLFGNEPTKFHLFDVAAAIALFGGAPAPAYFGGRGTVYYSLLGGKLEGYESFQFSVGERCAIVPDDPLAGLNFIEYTDPSPNDQDIPPYARVLTKFALPMDETIYVPVPVLDANGEVLYVEELGYTPSVSYTFKKDFGDRSTVSLNSKRWIEDDVHNGLVLRPQEMLRENRWYKVEIKVKAIDEQSKTWLTVNNEVWSQDTVIRFKTGPYPEDLYEMVQYSIPMPYERYYLQNENSSGKIFFTQALPRDHYFPTANPGGLGQISYYIRLTNLHDQSEIELPFVNNCTGLGPHLRFNLPNLENEKVYALQVIRKNSIVRLQGSNNGKINLVNTKNARMTLETGELPPGETLKPFETLLYHTYFRTSKYDNLYQKIADAEVVNTTQIGNHATYGKRLKVQFEMEERFEKRDFRSFYPMITYSEGLEFSPRVKMTDIFNKPYHNNKAETRVNGLKNYYNNEVKGNWMFSWDFPTSLNVFWRNYSYHIIGSSKLNGSLDNPLTEGEIANLWSSYLNNGSFSYSVPLGSNGVYSLNDGSFISGKSYNVIYNSHYQVGRDKEIIINWANAYLSMYGPGFIPFQTVFQNSFPAFIQKKNQLNNTNMKLENNNGTYGIHFNRNNSHVPGGYLWSWFINDIQFQSTSIGSVITISNTPIFLGN